MAGRAHPSNDTVTPSHVPLIVPSATPTHQMPHPLGGSSAPPLPLHDTNPHASQSANLLTPAFFAPPPPSSTSVTPPASSMMPTAPPLHPTSTAVQHPSYGTPLLQPFPAPSPPPSLTPAHNDGLVISRDKVKDTLQRLVQVCMPRIKLCNSTIFVCYMIYSCCVQQNDEFIDLIYRELQSVHM